MDLGIYPADFFIWTFGEPVLVQGMRMPDSPSDPDGGRRGSEMTGFVTAEMTGGVVVSIGATWDYPQMKLPPGINDMGLSCRIVCEGGVVVTPDNIQGRPAVFYPAKGRAPVFLDMPKVEPELSQVVSSAERRGEFPVTGREGRRSVAFIQAALDSIATGRAINPR